MSLSLHPNDERSGRAAVRIMRLVSARAGTKTSPATKGATLSRSLRKTSPSMPSLPPNWIRTAMAIPTSTATRAQHSSVARAARERYASYTAQTSEITAMIAKASSPAPILAPPSRSDPEFIKAAVRMPAAATRTLRMRTARAWAT